MPQRLTMTAAALDNLQTLTLGDVQYTIRYYWRQRLGGWYFELMDIDGNGIALGRRLSTSYSLLQGLLPEDAPPGILYVRGPAEYRRDDLGSTLMVLYYPPDGIPEAPESDLLVVL